MSFCFLCGNKQNNIHKCPACHKIVCKGCVNNYKLVQKEYYYCVHCLCLNLDPNKDIIIHLFEPRTYIFSSENKIQTINIPIKTFIIDKELITDIEFRCLKLDSRGIKILGEQTYCDFFSLYFNQQVFKENVQPVQYDSSLKKRIDNPECISIQYFSTLIRDQNNCFQLKGKNNFDEKSSFLKDAKIIRYYIMCVGTRYNNDEIMLNNGTLRILSEQQSRDIIKLKLQNKEEMLDGIDIDLTCNITLSPLQKPVRGSHCTHQNCFSLTEYLKITRGQRHLKNYCPICKKPMQYFVLDQFIQNLIQQNKNLDQVLIQLQGNELIYKTRVKEDSSIDEENVIMMTEDEDQKSIEDTRTPEQIEADQQIENIVQDRNLFDEIMLYAVRKQQQSYYEQNKKQHSDDLKELYQLCGLELEQIIFLFQIQ